MSHLDQLLENNKNYAAEQSAAGTLMPSLPAVMPRVKATIIGCVDMRVDPAVILGTKPGEAAVIRNVGGRITPELVEQLGMLGRIGQIAGVARGGGEYHLILMQHTDCGITRLAGEPAMLKHFFHIEDGDAGEGTLAAKAVTDPRAAVAADVALLRAVPTLPAAWIISGLVYDVATGLVEVVVPQAPMRPS
jgi:carbonic anhydrase